MTRRSNSAIGPRGRPFVCRRNDGSGGGLLLTLLPLAFLLLACQGGRQAEKEPAASSPHAEGSQPVASVSEASRDTPTLDPRVDPRLDPNQTLRADVASGETLSFAIATDAGRWLAVEVEQHGIDVAARLVAPDGRPTAVADSPTGEAASERLFTVTSVDGFWTLVVSAPPGGRSGTVVVRRGSDRAASAEDERLSRAAQRLAAAEALWWRGAKQPAAKTYREAGDLLSNLRRPEIQGPDPAGQAAAERDLIRLHLTGEIEDRLGRLAAGEGRYGEAQGHHRRAAEAFGAAGEDLRAAISRLHLGTALFATGHHAEAREPWLDALPVLIELGTPALTATASYNLGHSDQRLGALQPALERYRVALGAAVEAGAVDQEARTRHNRGLVYLGLGSLSRAEDDLKRAEALWRQLGQLGERARTLDKLAQVARLRGDLERAETLAETTLALRKELADEHGTAVTLLQLGLIDRRGGRLDSARSRFEAALSRFETAGDRASEGRALQSLALIALDDDDSPNAIALYRSALERHHEVGDTLGEARALFGLAAAERSSGDILAALETVRRSVERFDSVGAGPAADELIASALATAQRAYDLWVDLLIEQAETSPSSRKPFWIARAFEASERGRARILRDLVASSGAASRNATASVAGADERNDRHDVLSARIDALDRRRREAPDEAAAIDRRLRELTLELQEMRARRREQASPPAALEAHSLEEIQARLSDDTLLIAVRSDRRRSHLWAVERAGISHHLLPAAHELDTIARRAWTRTRRSGRREALAGTQAALCEASRMFLEPVADSLKRTRQLIVVADGATALLPLAALPIAGEDCSGPPLADSHSVSTLPAASLLVDLVDRRVRDSPETPGTSAHRQAFERVLVVADPVFSLDDPRVGRRSFATTGTPTDDVRAWSTTETLPRLAGSAREAQKIEEAIGRPDSDTRSLIRGTHPESTKARFVALRGFEASKESLRNGAARGFDILHMATHGLLDAEHPELSALALSGVDQSGRPIDGLLRSYEIYRLPTHADLVVLSACDTALGREVRGEGVIGLTRGFFHAGAKHVVVSLWSVDDRATAELMGAFYRALFAENASPAEALRKAQIELAADSRWRAPAHWAGFVVQGVP